MKMWIAYPDHGMSIEIYADNEKEARKMVRFYLGVEKLPKGTKVVRV